MIFLVNTCNLDNPSSPIYWNRVSNPAFFWKSNTRIPHFEMLLQNKWMIKTSLLSYKEWLAQLTFYVSHIYIYNWPYQIDALFMKYFLQIFCYVGFQHFQMPNPNRYMHLQMLPKSHKYHLHLKCHLEHTIFLFRTKSNKLINLKILPILMNEFGFYIKGFRCFNCQWWSSYHDNLSDDSYIGDPSKNWNRGQINLQNLFHPHPLTQHICHTNPHSYHRVAQGSTFISSTSSSYPSYWSYRLQIKHRIKSHLVQNQNRFRHHQLLINDAK